MGEGAAERKQEAMKEGRENGGRGTRKLKAEGEKEKKNLRRWSQRLKKEQRKRHAISFHWEQGLESDFSAPQGETNSKPGEPSTEPLGILNPRRNHRPGWMLKQTNDSDPGVVSERTACLTGPRWSSPGDSSPARPPSVCTTHSCFNWVTSLVSIWLIKERYYLQISMSQSYFLLIKKNGLMRKRIKAKNLNYFPPKVSWVAVVAVAKKCLNNRILTRRLESKQHEEILKAKQPPLSHACKTIVQKMSDESPFVQAERWAKALTEPLIAHPLVYTPQRWWLDKQLISLEIGPNLGGVGGSLLHVIEEEQAEFSWE